MVSRQVWSRYQSPGDDLIDWNLGVSSHRTSIRTSTKSFFSDFDLIWCVGRPLPDMHTIVTSTRSKEKVKVTELVKLHFSRSISSAVFARSSKLMVAGDSMWSNPQLVGARFSNFLIEKLSREFKLRGMSIFDEIQNGHISVVREVTVRWLGMLVVLQVLCMLMWPWPDPKWRSRSRSF